MIQNMIEFTFGPCNLSEIILARRSADVSINCSELELQNVSNKYMTAPKLLIHILLIGNFFAVKPHYYVFEET